MSLPDGFGPRSALSLFLYNQDGSQGLARTFLDGLAPGHTDMPSDYPAVPRLHLANSYDDASNAPSQNFVYDFDVYRYFVNREWQQVLATDAGGAPRSGSLAALADAFAAGAEVKVGVDDLCADMEPLAASHTVFVQAGSCYYYTDRKLFIAGSQPVIRVQPAIPLVYQSGGWDLGWLVVRSDGRVVQRLYDPSTLRCRDQETCCPLRWFVR